MNDNSWLFLQDQDPTYMLPADLAGKDTINARDCGWVEQMRPFIRQFSQPGQQVLDPFCGFGSTLVAAHIEGRRGIGIEFEAARADIAAERLAHVGTSDQQVFTGTATDPGLAELLSPSQLILTDIPYLGCGWSAKPAGGTQLYDSAVYADFLNHIHLALAALKSVLLRDGFLVVMAQNLRLGRHFVPLAWDIARLMSDRFELLEERILVYPRPMQPMPAGTTRSNRCHEYALIARNSPKAIDLDDTLACLKELASDHPDFVLYGSFAVWLLASGVRDTPPIVPLPSDADLLVPDDPALLQALTAWLEQRGFRPTRWGAPVHSDLIRVAKTNAHYLRFERLRSDGRLCLIDLCFGDDELHFADIVSDVRTVQGIKIFTLL